jgi:hypothetical protein
VQLVCNLGPTPHYPAAIIAGHAAVLALFDEVVHVRFGSLADILISPHDVRFTPKSGHAQPPASMSAKCQKPT